MKHKIYHVCSIEDARAIVKNGFKKANQEVILKKLLPKLRGFQGDKDVVSFTADNCSAWIVMKTVSAAFLKTKSASVFKLHIVAIEIEVDEKYFQKVAVTGAGYVDPAGQLMRFGAGVEIVLERSIVNRIISNGKVKIVNIGRIKKNPQLIEMAGSYVPTKYEKAQAKKFARRAKAI